jgi:Zn-dependent protease with chaperone function
MRFFWMASEVISTRPVRLRDYRYPGELLSLVLTFMFLVALYALATIYFPESWSATLKALTITLGGLVVFVISVKLQQRSAFGTLVRVSERQFPELYDLAMTAAERLSSPPVPVYVKRASEMNVYTLGLWQQRIIVLTSSLIDQMEPENLQFFIGREIGHIQAGHTWLRTLLKPLGADVPIIGRLLNSVIFGDWINRTEFTADRAGFIACRSLTTAINTMLKFGVGVRLYEKLDIREFLEQINDVRNVSGHITEIVAEQPYLTQRVRALVRYALSDQFRTIVPEKRGNTQILKALPATFVSANLNLAEMAESWPVEAEEGQGPETGRNEAVTVSEYVDLDSPDGNDENSIDPNFVLVSAGGDTPHSLRRRSTRIGRNFDNDIVINNDRVSRYHAEIVREEDEMRIIDKESRNGVWLNGKKISKRAEIKPGDVIRIGRQEFTLIELNL